MNGIVELTVLQIYSASILGRSCELNPSITEGSTRLHKTQENLQNPVNNSLHHMKMQES